MKRTFCILLCALLALMCAGCGSGVKLPGEAGDALKQAEDAVEELKTLLRENNAEELLDEVRALARSSADMEDAELSDAIGHLAAEKGVTLRDNTMPQLIRLVRIIEKSLSFRDRVETARDKVGDAAGKVGDAVDSVGSAVDSVKDVFKK